MILRNNARIFTIFNIDIFACSTTSSSLHGYLYNKLCLNVLSTSICHIIFFRFTMFVRAASQRWILWGLSIFIVNDVASHLVSSRHVILFVPEPRVDTFRSFQTIFMQTSLNWNRHHSAWFYKNDTWIVLYWQCLSWESFNYLGHPLQKLLPIVYGSKQIQQLSLILQSSVQRVQKGRKSLWQVGRPRRQPPHACDPVQNKV